MFRKNRNKIEYILVAWTKKLIDNLLRIRIKINLLLKRFLFFSKN